MPASNCDDFRLDLVFLEEVCRQNLMHFLQEITIIATVSVLVTIILGRLKLPVIAGLVLSGAFVGPNGLSIAQDSEAIEVIAEVGVAFCFSQ